MLDKLHVAEKVDFKRCRYRVIRSKDERCGYYEGGYFVRSQRGQKLRIHVVDRLFKTCLVGNKKDIFRRPRFPPDPKR